MVLWYTVTMLLLFNDVTFQIARSSRPISFTCHDTLSDLNDFTYKHRIRGQQQPKRLSIGVGTIVLVRTVHTSPYELWEPIRETNSNLSIGTGYEKTWRRRDKAQVESQSARPVNLTRVGKDEISGSIENSLVVPWDSLGLTDKTTPQTLAWRF